MSLFLSRFWRNSLLTCLLGFGAACSSLGDLIGQRPVRPTPTLLPFATATVGGRVAVWLREGTARLPAEGAPQRGQIVPPAATATAIAAALGTATAAAQVPFLPPQFETGACPLRGNPPPPPPTRFSQYPEAISLYLSAGGAPTVLEAALRAWGAVREGAVVQSDTDLTANGAPEIIITAYDPSRFQAGAPSPGKLLIFGCVQGAYRLLYSTTYSPESLLPVLHRVGDMNGDARAELVYSQRICTAGGCATYAQILSWNALLGQFRPLNPLPIDATNGRIGIGDPDGDGVLELFVSYNPPLDFNSAPPRRSVVYWDWNGENYLQALIELEPAAYRIHALHDADQLFAAENWRDAIRLYDRVRDDPTLLAWSVPNETALLRAFATLRKAYAQLAADQRRNANATFEQLIAENPPGTPAEGYALIGRIFLETLTRTRDRARACEAARTLAQARPETLAALNSYGAARLYRLEDLCPFR
ncbi:MAG: VCBS repeat-containing protein [Chloroflexota bacterium]|nr:MAG: VCBS repeat-containing protein [Chloroflexota bacterium]